MVIDVLLSDSLTVVTSEIDRVGPKSSSLIVKTARSSEILALLAFDKLILAVSLFSSIASARMGTTIDPDVSPAKIVNVPDVAV